MAVIRHRPERARSWRHLYPVRERPDAMAARAARDKYHDIGVGGGDDTGPTPTCGVGPVYRCCGDDQAWRTASPSISILILRLTSTPPVSRATFQVRPNSSRSISVLAEKPKMS